ncbi:MAG: NAD(P)-dependent alcohol dehydrogenase [Pseudomonadota bacterium]|nr:NAD(P)-dependent alcohol dehydrogenase [Pseudomonadota bacterium]
MKITAAVCHGGDQPFALEELDLEAPQNREVLVRVVGVGICRTDLLFRNMPQFLQYPAVLGHEASGIVQAVGSSVTKVKPGDRVAISFNSCGDCCYCRADEPIYCESNIALNWGGRRPDGSRALRSPQGEVSSHFFGQSSFATHALATEQNVVRLPLDAPLELAGPLGCGIQTGAGAIMRSLACERGSSVAIFGGGAVGLSAVMGAVIQGCRSIIVVEPVETRRALALELGATHAIDPLAEDIGARIREIAPAGVNFAFDSTGREDILDLALASMARGGTLGVVAASDHSQRLPGNLAQLIICGYTVKGIIEGDSNPDSFIPELLDHYRAGRFPFTRLIRTFSFSAINEAVEAHRRGECVKAVLLMPEHN